MNDDRTLLPEQIRNLPCKPYDGTDAYTHYCHGHRDARHAAAELAAAALSAAPAQEPVGEPLTLDQRYWLDRRGDIIAALEAEGLQIWSDKDRVWLHRLSASPLPQEPQEGKELTDLSVERLMELVKTMPPRSMWPERRAHLNEIEAIARELRAAQEGKAGEWRTVERDGMPPCDGETVFVGINSAGFACCFNEVTKDGVCSMQGPELSTVQMSALRYWRVLDRPSATLSASSKGEQR